MKRIGVYGGTFNPIHIAHLITAEEVAELLHLEKVLFILSANHPLKDTNGIIDPEKRMKMINLAIKGNETFEASDIEIKLSGLPAEVTVQAGKSKSYTVDTLVNLREQYKNEQVKFYLIIGMDNLIELHTWKDPGKLFILSEVIVINRPRFYAQDVKNDFGRQVTYVPVSNIDISASEIRNRIRENRTIKYLVPEKVEKFIIQNNLYKQ
ncbi:MAG TPA: nicotinate-nucleotide adenylyltransferase [Ignavibacteria bacterium]